MEENNGWIHLFRKFIDWEWYDCPNVKIVFLHCLLMANHKTGKWQGITIKRGQFVSSYEKIAAANGLSVQQVRTSIKKLKMTHEINTQTTNLYTLISVNNYDLYQDTLTNKQQSNNNQITTNKNDKNNNTINTSYINTHTIEKNVCVKNSNIEISQEDKKILRTYAKNNGAKNISAYVHQLIVNGGYLEILETEKKKIEKRRAELARFLEAKQEQEKEPELTQEERQAVLARARELAGINKKRSKQNGKNSSKRKDIG